MCILSVIGILFFYLSCYGEFIYDVAHDNEDLVAVVSTNGFCRVGMMLTNSSKSRYYLEGVVHSACKCVYVSGFSHGPIGKSIILEPGRSRQIFLDVNGSVLGRVIVRPVVFLLRKEGDNYIEQNVCLFNMEGGNSVSYGKMVFGGPDEKIEIPSGFDFVGASDNVPSWGKVGNYMIPEFGSGFFNGYVTLEFRNGSEKFFVGYRYRVGENCFGKDSEKIPTKFSSLKTGVFVPCLVTSDLFYVSSDKGYFVTPVDGGLKLFSSDVPKVVGRGACVRVWAFKSKILVGWIDVDLIGN